MARGGPTGRRAGQVGGHISSPVTSHKSQHLLFSTIVSLFRFGFVKISPVSLCICLTSDCRGVSDERSAWPLPGF